jgi:transcriptional regulator with XRE-family HTH domain
MQEPSGERITLATMLKNSRLAAGLSAAALGERLHWSQSKVSKLENGTRGASPADVAAWAEAVGASADQRASMVQLADLAASRVSSWWRSHAAGLAKRQDEMADAEARATSICNFHPALIPPLLQTADYARQVLELANVSGQGDVAAAAAARMRRQEALYDLGKRHEFVLTPAAFTWRLSSTPGAMAAVADRVISVDSLPNVTVAVLPPGAVVPVLPVCGFGIFEVPDDPFVVVETLTTELILTGERDLAVYRAAFARLREVAVTGRDAHDLIRSAAAAPQL